MAQNREEWEKEYVSEQQDEQKKVAEESRSAAEEARFDEPDTVETEEQYYERLNAVRGTMIFGDTDTTAGADASGTDVPSADNEAAQVAVAEAHVDQQEGDVDEDVTSNKARRQVDVSASGLDAEAVDEGADEQVSNDPARDPANAPDDAVFAEAADDDEEDNLTPAQKAARTRAANRAAAKEED